MPKYIPICAAIATVSVILSLLDGRGHPTIEESTKLDWTTNEWTINGDVVYTRGHRVSWFGWSAQPAIRRVPFVITIKNEQKDHASLSREMYESQALEMASRGSGEWILNYGAIAINWVEAVLVYIISWWIIRWLFNLGGR